MHGCVIGGRARISTHSAREDGDDEPNLMSDHIKAISTHSAREDGDAISFNNFLFFTISTHSAREDGDTIVHLDI